MRMRDWTDEHVQEWINTQLARSEIDLGIDVSPEDTFNPIYLRRLSYFRYYKSSKAIYISAKGRLIEWGEFAHFYIKFRKMFLWLTEML